MADGTVRGRFDLDSQPAINGVRAIRTASLETDVAVRQLGDTIDGLAGRSAATAGAVRESFRSINDSVDDTTRKAKVRIDELDVKLAELGRKRATPTVDLTGVDRAVAQIAVLDQRLDALGRQRATPRVALGGGFGGGAGGFSSNTAGGGGSAAASAARASGGGGFPTAPFLIGAAGTAIPPLAGTAAALTGSAAAAAAGAGAVGMAGLGTLAVGGGTELAIARGQTKEIQTAIKDQTAYNNAVAQYGATSRQAATAKAKLDAEYAQNPGLHQATHEVNQLEKAWHAATQQADRHFRLMIGDVARPAAGALPALEPGITRDSFAVRQQAGHLAGFLTSGVSLQTVQQLQGEFARDLPLVEKSLENILTTTDHIVQAALPWFHQGNVWIERQTAGWAQWSNNTGRVQQDVDHLVTSLKDWEHLGGAGFRDLKDLLVMGRPSGDSAVVSMTHTLDRWDVWLRDNPAKVRQFFSDAERTTSNLARAVVSIADALWKVSVAFGPVLSRFAQLATLGNGLGLLLPTALRFGANRFFGGGGGGAAGAAGAAAVVAGGGPRAGGGVVVGGAPAALQGGAMLAPSFAGSATAGDATTLATLAAYGRLRPTVRIEGAMPAGGIATPEAFRAAYGDVAGARYAGPASQLGRRVFVPGTDVGVSTAGLRGAAGTVGRYAGPILAIQAAIGAATTRGSLMERAQGGLSAATFGLIPAPVTSAGHVGAGQAAAAGYVQQIQGMSPQEQYARLGSFISHERGIRDPKSQPFDITDPFTTKPGFGNQERVRAEIAALKDAQRQVGQVLDQQAQQQAQSYSANFGKAFDVYSKREGPHKAFRDMSSDIRGELTALRPAGRTILAQNALDWAKAAAQANPALRKQYQQLTTDIQNQFDQLGQHIAIVNGNIYTGSKTEWGQITQAMQDPLEKAREKMTGAFTDIQNQAVGSLVAMGFTHDQAHTMVHGLEQGGKSGAAAALAVGGRQSGGVLGGTYTQGGLAALNAAPPKRARGGRLPGVGVADTVRMSDGGYGAPGELVVNPFTEADVSRDLQMAGKPTLGERVAREWRPAYMQRGNSTAPVRTRFAIGGALSAVGAPVNGQAGGGSGGYVFPFPQGAHVNWSRVDQGQDLEGPSGGYVVAIGPGSVTMAPPDPGGFGSHYPLLTLTSGPLMGRTVYYGHTKAVTTGPVSAAQVIAQTGFGRGDASWQGNASGIPGHLEIGFWPPGSMSSGSSIAGLMHMLASHQAGAVGGVGGALAGIGQVQQVALHGLGTQGLRGVPGALLDRGSQIIARGMQQKLNAKLAALGGIGGAGAGALGINGNIMQIAQQAAAAAGLQFDPSIVSTLLQKESSGGQNLPPHSYGGALDPAGPFQVISGTFAQYDPGGNRMNPADNALAAMRYIRSRYGSLQGMAAQTGLMGGGYHGYALGGRVAKWGGWHDSGLDAVTKPGQPVVFGAGERRPERVTITPVAGGGGARSSTGGAHVSIGQIVVQGSIRSDADIERIGEHVAAKLIEALDRGDHRAAELT